MVTGRNICLFIPAWVLMLPVGYCSEVRAALLPIGNSPVLGDEGAPVRVTVFFNFHCPHCRGEMVLLDGLRREYGDALAVVFKHFPLSSAPNAVLTHALGQIIYDDLGAAAWETYLHAIFEADEITPAVVEGAAAKTQIDPVMLKTLLADPIFVTDMLEPDAALSRQLKVSGSPTVYLNGQRLQDRSLEGYRAAIDAALADTCYEKRFCHTGAGRYPRIPSAKVLYGILDPCPRSGRGQALRRGDQGDGAVLVGNAAASIPASSQVDDLTGDCKTDYRDFAVMAGVWLSDPNCGGNPQCPDRDGDHLVGPADLLDLVSRFANGATRGIGFAFIGDPIDFTTGLYKQPQEVCLTNLGIYDPETGTLTGDNFDAALNGYVLRGSLASSGRATTIPELPGLAVLDNDFRIPFVGSPSVPADRSTLWASELNRLRRDFF